MCRRVSRPFRSGFTGQWSEADHSQLAPGRRGGGCIRAGHSQGLPSQPCAGTLTACIFRRCPMKFMQRDGNTAMRSLAWFVLVGAVAAGACGFGAQRAKPKSLLKRVDLERVSLTEKQSRILDRIQKAPSTVQLLVVSFDEKA